MNNFIDFFVSGGLGGMSVITLILVAIFLAAWKAPAWVNNLGKLGLTVGIIWTLSGIFQMTGYLGEHPDTSVGIIYNGIRVSLIPCIYGALVFGIASVICIFQKPRLY